MRAIDRFRVGFALALSAAGVCVALSPSLTAKGGPYFGQNGGSLAEIMPSLSSFVVVAGLIVAVAGVLSLLVRSGAPQILVLSLSVALVVVICVANSPFTEDGEIAGQFKVIELGGLAPSVAVLSAGLAFVLAGVLLVLRYRPAALMPVLREPSPSEA